MKKKVFSLMMMLVFAFIGLARAEEVTVYEGTATNNYVPAYVFYFDDFTRSQYVIPAADLAAVNGGTITSVKFYTTSNNMPYTTVSTVDVYLKEVDYTTISAFEAKADCQVVYTGTLEFVTEGDGGTCVITFSTPFTYNGGNLLVGCENTTDAGYKNIYFYGQTVSDASVAGYNASSLDNVVATQRNFIPKTTFTYNGGGGGGGGTTAQLFALQDGEVVETVSVGVRPNGCWMEPFTFQIRNDGGATTLSLIDFTPRDYFTVVGPELPVQVAHNGVVDVQLTTGTSTNTDWQMVAIYGTGRTARVWNITADPYNPETPDVWELACQEATSFPFVEVPATAHNTTLHNDYTLPFPEIPEGYDAVYKLVFAEDQMLDAEVTYGANGKVALYTQDFYGQGGPMADNYYVGFGGTSGGGSTGAPFEAMIGDETSTTYTAYMPFYTLYNYSISEALFTAAELAEAGVTTASMTSLSWEAIDVTTTQPQNNISIWMANVEDTELTTTSHNAAEMTLVYTGNIATVPPMGWNEFVFNEGNFAWDGVSNVLILCQRNNGQWSGHVNWRSHNPGFYGMTYKYQDSTPYDAMTQTYAVTRSNTSRPNTMFKSTGRNRDEVLFADTFEAGDLSNWTLIDADNDGDGWQIATPATYGIGDAHSGSYCASSWSWNSYSMDPDNYMISPLVDGASSITYYVATNTGYPDHYAVMASTTGNAISNFVTVFEEDAYRGGDRSGVRSSMTQPGTRVMSDWAVKNITLPAGTKYVAFRHYNSYDMNYLFIDDVTIYGNNGTPTPPPGPTPPDPPTPPTPTPTPITYSAGPVITDMPVAPGTYYLVASSTDPDFEVTINAEAMPCPDVDNFVFSPTPADNEDEVEPASVTLRWMIPTYATGWRIIFGSTYYPDPNHPQTVMYPADGSFTNQMANSYTVRNLWNNTNYFWHVEFNNDGCPAGVSSPIWGFTTHLNIPQGLTADDETVFNDETITLSWNAVVDRTFRTYFIYRDGVKIGETTTNNIGATTYTDGPLAYNMTGYTYYVTSVYDEGESAPSNTVNVKVSGRGSVNGHVYEQDGTTGIANATVTMVGTDEFGDSHTYTATTNASGYYTATVYAGEYNGSAYANGYFHVDEPIQGNPINVAYNATTSPIDYMMDENFDPVCAVIAQYYPDSLNPDAPYVKVYWGCGLPGSDIIEPFETGDFSLFEWQIDPTYPWSITTNDPYEGEYCMKSGGAGVANVISNMTVTVDIPADGLMSFFGKISCESNWDYGYFYIDGVQKGSYTGAGSWGEKKFDITAGEHTFRWQYTKDGSVNSNDDCFYVDYITFYKQPEPAQPGWHTYCESEFNNALGSNLTTTPSWAYEYPASFLNNNYAGWNLTKVSLFSDNLYSAVGGNYTCRIYVGGTQPAAGTMVSTITVDVPSNQNAWVDWDLTTPVNVTGTDPIWVVWTANSTVSNWPAGLCGDQNDYGNWWDGGNGWEHQTYGTWTMRHWFTNRSGRSVAVSNEAIVDNNPISSELRTFVKGEEETTMTCANPNAKRIAGNSMTRRFSHYRVYRTACYNDGPYTLLDETQNAFGNTRVLGCEVTDTVFIDTYWNDPQFTQPGIYKWGVGVVYVGNRGEEIESPITWSEPLNINPETASRQVVTIGEGTSTTYVTPFNSLWGYSVVEQLFTAAEIGTAGAINSISFNLRESDAAQTNQVDVFMKNVSRTNFASSTDFEPLTAGDMVFSGTVTFNPGWTTITLDSPFAYNGTDNLLIALHEYTSGYSTRYFYYTSAPDMVLSYHSDSANPDPYDLGSYSGNKYTSANRANIQIDITPGGGGSGSGDQPTVNGGTEPVQEPRESVIVWSNCLDKNMYLTNVDVNVLLNSADSPEGAVVSFTNCNEAEQQLYPISPITIDETGFYAFESFRRGAYIVTVEKEGYYPIQDSINLIDYPNNLINELHLRYVMTEILYGVENIYVSRTGWAMWDDSHNNPGGGIPTPGPGPGPGPGGNGDTFSVNFDDSQMPAGWTTIDANNDGYNWVLGSQIGGIYLVSGASLAGSGHNSSADLICSGSYSNASGQAITPDNYLVSPQVNIASGSTFSFWACAQDASYAAEHFGVFISDNGTSNWTAVQEWTMTAKSGGSDVMSIGRDGNNRAQGTWHQYTVDLSAFAGQKYIAIRHFNCNDQFILDVDDIELTAGRAGGDRHFEFYKVMCTSIDGVPIYNHNTVYPFCQLSTNEPYNAPLVEGEHYLVKVASVYSTGVSEWSEPVEWEYEPCDHWGPVDEVTVNTTNQGNHIEWVFDHGYNPYGGDTPGPGPGPGGASTFSVNFDDSQMPAGWTTIDANNDGYNWVLGTQVGGIYLVSGASLEGTGHNSSTDLICSGSYSNASGQAITPDNYLVSPQVTLAAGSTFSFWACAQDASYAAEHFGVFISDNGTSNWTSVQEWTMTAKNGGSDVMSIGRDGNNRAQGTWHQYTVDLSAFAGQKYIAIRHFNCNDQFILDVDDIELTAGAKGGFSFAKGGEFYSQYAEDGIMLNFFAIDNVDLRAFLLYNLSNDSRFSLVSEDEYGQFILTSNDVDNFLDEFETVYQNTLTEFSMISKVDLVSRVDAWKSGVAPSNFLSVMMDVIMSNNRPDNDHCINSLPFCTSETITFEAASTDQTANEPNMNDGCIGSSYNPSFYHMRIHTAGQFVIHMEGHDPNTGVERDIDFCIWGPYTQEEVTSGTACSNLTGDKIMDCCYSAQYDEDCYLGYPDGQHNHHGSSTSHGTINYHVPEVGEYYILMITNFSRQPCVINFTKTEGVGETDCDIVVPSNIIGFLITQDGEYLDFVGPDEREYTDIDEFGDHVYCVRPIYPGTMILPDQNFGWSMGCPVCESTNGEIICEPGAPIYAEAMPTTDQVKVWWGDQNPGPGPGPGAGDEFTVDFESGIPTGWTTIDGGSPSGYGWQLGDGSGITGHNSTYCVFSQSYDNNYGPINPDNYLISPAVTLGNGSTFSFWACAQDGSYAAEHFGVAISDDGTTFGMVQEWTMTAKGEGKTGGVNRGGRAQGNWYQYTVDLSQYAGEGRYIAIRHFNCTDQFYLDVDDIELSNGAKNRADIQNYNVYRSTSANGEYTIIGVVPAVAGQTYYEYIDTPETAGTYYYQVRADYGDCESEPAISGENPNVNYVTASVDAVGENSDNVALFPNPTSGNVTIQARGMNRVTVVSMIGQVVYDTELSADEITLNMSQFNAGMYIVNVYTENGVAVKRVTVMK